MDTFSKKGVEIFSVGNWNGDDYTLEDMQCMVQAFAETRSGMQPHLKLGHDPKQKLIQQDGLPAAGWVEKLYIVGDKLVADFSDIPKKVFELIQSKAYKKVSSEIFWNLKVGDKTYKRVLAAVALLGANTPGVSNLSDILAMYTSAGKACDDIKLCENTLELSDSEINKEGGTMPQKTEQEVKLEYDLQKTESDLKAATDKLTEAEKLQAAKDQEIADLKQYKADAEAKNIKLQQDAQAAELKNFVTSLKAEKLCTPAMEPLVTELLGESKKEYSVKLADKEQKLSKEQLFKETLKLFKAAAEVNFEENSTQGDDGKKDQSAEIADKKAKEYMAKNEGVTYGQAIKIVMKEIK